MALKKLFREATHNELGFSFSFCSVLSGLDDCYYCSNIIVSLLFKLCAKFSLELSRVCMFIFQELLVSFRLELSRVCMFILFREFACCSELCVLTESR